MIVRYTENGEQCNIIMKIDLLRAPLRPNRQGDSLAGNPALITTSTEYRYRTFRKRRACGWFAKKKMSIVAFCIAWYFTFALTYLVSGLLFLVDDRPSESSLSFSFWILANRSNSPFTSKSSPRSHLNEWNYLTKNEIKTVVFCRRWKCIYNLINFIPGFGFTTKKTVYSKIFDYFYLKKKKLTN